MVVDRVHRAPRILGVEEKGILRDVEAPGAGPGSGRAGAAPVQAYVGGVVLNHLGWAAALGLRAGIFGRQGDDEPGRFLRAAMDRAGIERDLCLEGGGATSMAEIFVDDGGGRAIYMAPGATAETTAEHVRKAHAAFISRSARVTTEVSQLPLATALETLRIAREAGAETVVDLDVPPSDALATLGDEATLHAVLAAADLLKPSKSAARELEPEAGTDPLALARSLRARFGCRAVVVTDGAAGCAISAVDFEGRVPAPRVDPVDTTGAGDAFLGGILAGRHHGLSWEDAGALANAAGAACCEKLGAFPDDAVRARTRVLELYAGGRLPPALTASGPTADAAPGGESARSGDAALRTLDVAVAELGALRDRLDAKAFARAADLVESARGRGGRVHVTGVGKCEHVAHYAASLLSSTGTPATFLHATEAVHGSAGQVVEGDVVVAISHSGTTAEILATLAAVGDRGARVLAVTGAADSPLASGADAVLEVGVEHEGGPLDLAPRASVAVQVVALAALASLLQERVGLSRAEYHARHPSGALGQRSGGPRRPFSRGS